MEGRGQPQPMQEKLRLDNSVRNGNRGRRWVETQIGEAEHDLSLPKIVGSAVGGWTPTIGSQISQTRQWDYPTQKWLTSSHPDEIQYGGWVDCSIR